LGYLIPQTSEELARFYFILCILYVVVHLVWDAKSKETPPFSIGDLHTKLNEVYSSTTFSTSIFFVIIIFQPGNPLRNTDAITFPLILASLTGMFISLSALKPKKRT
jgi:hypothetical protein